ncbi:unnamed protein product [Tilletia laevis]|uniref:[histone H3]-trimethyl-L-lysine(4) demethylase n=2 Tax=Tilletia TaxID=13289 RepID=A0A8T8TRM2_9BASI|nr:hypothetical protein A4X03_0g588 [Tilletia caries]CAD6897746.1 unnamed protein product [Tilletia laevis]CAD6908691.1 unnamed protein product [Tilletia controversa]CAD6888737.1 unnamed protein product [Tilletia caries]CAD6914242.1 unnamed protein product [Tilletia controversa]
MASASSSSSKLPIDPAAISAAPVANLNLAGPSSGSTPSPAKIPKKRGRPAAIRPAINADDSSSTASTFGSPPKPPGKRRGRPPGSGTKNKPALAPPPAIGNGFQPANSANVVISSLAYTPPDPSNHPLRKSGQIEPAPRLNFNTAAPSSSTASADDTAKLIPTHFSTPRMVPSRSKTRVFGLEEAPIFYPTIEEFADPIKYIAWCAAPDGGNAKEFGIAKIVPPEGWSPDFVLDQEKLRFRTRLQRLNSLSAEARATLNYHEQLQKFHTQQGSKRVSIPIIDRKPTDLYKLRRVVDSYGGLDAVIKGRKWTEVTRKMGYPEKESAQLSAQVKAAYIKIIMPFEVFITKAKEQGRTVNFSAAVAPGAGPSMTMAGSAPLQSGSAAANGAPQLQMTINDASPEPSTLAADEMKVDERDQSQQVHNSALPQSPAAQQLSTASPHPTDAASDINATGGADLPSTAPREANGLDNAQSSPSNSASASNVAQKIDGETGPAAAVAADLALASSSSTPDMISFSDQLAATGLCFEEIEQLEAEAAGKRRSGRKRTETTSQTAPPTPTSGRKRKFVDETQAPVIEILTTQGAEEQSCEICLRGDNGTSMLLCDDCNRGYHMFCLDPPMTTIPKSQWFCPPCLVGTGNDFGFDDGETHSLHSFWQRADLFRNSWWSIKKRNEEDSTMRAAMFGAALVEKPAAEIEAAGEAAKASAKLANGGGGATSAAAGPSAITADGDVVMQGTSSTSTAGQARSGSDKVPIPSSSGKEPSVAATTTAPAAPPIGRGLTRPIAGTQYTVSEDEIEREYWRLIHSLSEAVEVEYGADIHSTTHGSALPTLETHPENPYSKDAWNLNNLPITAGSLLRYIKSDISGMTVPWIYVGMMFSTFCWHNEDHYTYSVNYQHWGDTKTWYGVPGADAEKFEEAMRKVAPDLFETSPDLLFQLVTMMSPEKLREQGVRVYAADQRPNEFVVTFPKAYHSGFNQGFNLNEAVNFALPDWIDTGLECVKRYQQYHKFPVFSHDELLCTILHQYLSVNSATWLRKPIGDMVDRELAARRQLLHAHSNVQIKLEERDRPEAEYQCSHCNVFCYLSQVISGGSGGQVACLEHASKVCGPDDSATWTLRLRFSDEYLSTMQTKVSERANQPASWKTRFRKLLLSSPRPSLKSLRSLLADGDRITGLPEVAQLREFVEKANDWLERACTFLYRRTMESRRSRTGGPDLNMFPDQSDGKEVDRTPEQVHALLEEVENLGFDCSEIALLNGIVNDIAEFKQQVAEVFAAEEAGTQTSLSKCFELQERGDKMDIEMVERKELATYLARRTWFCEAEQLQPVAIGIEDAEAMLTEAERCNISADEPLLIDFKERTELGRQWIKRARALANLSAPEPRITLEELEELLGADSRVPTDEELRETLDTLHKKFIDFSKILNSFISTQEEKNHRFQIEHKVEDPSGLIQGARKILNQIDKSHLAIPNAEVIRMHVLRHDSWVKRFEDVVLDAFSPFSTPSRTRLDGMMDALCSEISHTADPKDHYPSDPARRHCVCRTLEKPPDLHREVRKCTSCLTSYHAPCLKIEEKWSFKDWEQASRVWKCPICDPSKLPSLLQHRQTLSLNAITPLVKEEDWDVSNFLFIPQRWYPLRRALARLQGLTEAVADFLSESPTPAVPSEAFMLWHSMRKVLACPVDVMLPDGNSVVDEICHILYRHAKLDESGNPLTPRSLAARDQRVETSRTAPANSGAQRPSSMLAVPPPDQSASGSPHSQAGLQSVTHRAGRSSAESAHPPMSIERVHQHPVPARSPLPQHPSAVRESLLEHSTSTRSPLPQPSPSVRQPVLQQPSPMGTSPDVGYAQASGLPPRPPGRERDATRMRDPHLPPARHSLSSATRDVSEPRDDDVAVPSRPRSASIRTDVEMEDIDGAVIRDTSLVPPSVDARDSGLRTLRTDASFRPNQPSSMPRSSARNAHASRSPDRRASASPLVSDRRANITDHARDHDEAAPTREGTADGVEDPDEQFSGMGDHSDDQGDDSRYGSEAPGSTPALHFTLPKKRGKRAKLVFEEEIGSSIPIQGVLAPCLCRQHREYEMISCDRCSNWYHLDCVVVTPFQAKTDKRWSCPFCCLKTERKYQYAEVKVKDALCPPGVYVDVRATLRSVDTVIRKPQHWLLSNHRRIVLHLHHFVPAVSAGLTSDGQRDRDKDDGDDTPSVSHDGSARGSVLHDTEPFAGSSVSPEIDRSRHAPMPGESSHVHASEAGPSRLPSSSRHDSASAGQLERSDRYLPGKSQSRAPSYESPTPRVGDERHRLGMQNLYARGVTDAMIAKWYIGWDGHKLVYPHYDRRGRMVELDLGSSIKLDADDPDGSKLIQARVARKDEEERLEAFAVMESLHRRRDDEAERERDRAQREREREHQAREIDRILQQDPARALTTRLAGSLAGPTTILTVTRLAQPGRFLADRRVKATRHLGLTNLPLVCFPPTLRDRLHTHTVPLIRIALRCALTYGHRTIHGKAMAGSPAAVLLVHRIRHAAMQAALVRALRHAADEVDEVERIDPQILPDLVTVAHSTRIHLHQF